MLFLTPIYIKTFFNIKNDAIKNVSEYDGLAKPVYNVGPLKKAYKELFGKKLDIKETENPVKQKVKEFIVPLGIAVAVTSPAALLMYEVHDMNIKLQQAEERTKHVEEMEKKVQELESKTINMMDTIKQNNR